MSRSRHIPLERAETAVHGRSRGTTAVRRAQLEEELLGARACGDRARADELRQVLDRIGIGRRNHGMAARQQ